MKQFEKGGEVDPVSGNPVPLGSTEKEVRDDQPAMLSQGEMVIPADVVRYFGVEHFMKLRDEAKMGFKKMEAMGQFGTDEGQTLPDDTLFNAGGPPFTIEDIEVVEPDGVEEEALEANVGAFVQGGQGNNPFDQSFGPATNTTLANARKNPEGFLQSLGSRAFDSNDIINAIGSVNMDYLNFLSPAGIDLGQNKNSTRTFIDKYFTNFSRNLKAAVQPPTTVDEELEVESEDQDVGPTAGQGVGSISELASAPTAANIGAAKDFTELSSTTIGVMNSLISGALNPFGRSAFGVPGIAGKIGGTLSSMFSSGSIGLPFGLGSISVMDAPSSLKGNIDNIATFDQLHAQAVVSVAERTSKVDLDLMGIVGVAEQLGIDVVDIVNDPTVDLVSIENDVLGVGFGTRDRGRFGATYNANKEVISTWGQKATVVSPKDIKKGLVDLKNFQHEIVETMQMMNDPAIADRMGPGPQSAEDAMGIDDAADAEAAGAGTSAGTAGTGGPDSSGGGHDGTDGGDDGSDAADAAADATDEHAKGGLIKPKPRNKKRRGRKKRGGLGSPK